MKKLLLLLSITILTACGGGSSGTSEQPIVPGCNYIDNQIDTNCDGQLKFIFLGDSIVYGHYDNPNQGGYVNRLKNKLPLAKIENYSVPGLTSNQLLLYIRNNQHILNAVDYLFIGIGINDFWEQRSAGYTVDNIALIHNQIHLYYNSIGDIIPKLTVLNITPSKRPVQNNFINNVNNLLNTQNFLVLDINSSLNLTHISADGIHPTPEGHQILANHLFAYINHK